MPILLSLTLFRLGIAQFVAGYRDSEMVVWFSCGRPLTDWLRPVLKFALPIVLAIAVLSSFLSPWANQSRPNTSRSFQRVASFPRYRPAFSEEKKGATGIFRRGNGQ
jgi:lipopolysaccharide export system permease protein